MNLADAAKKLGGDRIIMDSYWNFQTKKQGWFFSPNLKLESATAKPKKFNTWDDWDVAAPNQKRTLATIAGFKEDATNIKRIDSDLSKLKSAYSKWQNDLYSVFWGNQYTGTWTCNIFVGDALYLAGRNIMASNRHYYDPRQIKSGNGFKTRKTIDEVKIGDIVVMHGGSHVEIVTKFIDYKFADKGFCSRGAGRGNQGELGIEKCDVNFQFDEDRELKNFKNSFHYL